MNIAVIGAGIIGTTTALAIKEAFPKFNVTIFSDVFSPHTTGDGSAGLWTPYILGNTPDDDVLRWSSETYRWMLSLWKSKLAGETGVILIPVTRVISAPEGYPRPPWMSAVLGARQLEIKDVQRLNAEHEAKYTDGWQFISFTSQSSRLIPWIMARFKSLGGTIKQRKVHELDELVSEGFDLLINCTGLGARDLIKDTTMYPVRGQVSKVDAPWIFHVYIADDATANYIIPNVDYVVLGGTSQKDDFDRDIRDKDAIFIHEGCCKTLPALRGREIVKQWTGLRPGRPSVRLEAESLSDKNGNKYTVIHNYGHGGSGVTLSWGCALDVVKIIRDSKLHGIESKL